MKMNIQVTVLAALLAAALTPMSTRAAAESGERAQETKAKIDAARAESAKIRAQVALSLEELNRLQKSSVELRPQFEGYTRELAKMEDQARVTSERVTQMSEKGRAYFQSWEDSIKTITNKDIREQAEKRYAKRTQSYDKIVKAMTAARDQMKPFMSDLNDLKTLFDNELSRESVKSAGKLIKQANWHGADVVESLKDVETELDRVSAELAKYK
jgi:chromosome segregation ATPase